MENIEKEIEQGSNIFILDGPIGRLRFFLVAIVLFGYCVFTDILFITYIDEGININIYLLIGLCAIFAFLIPFYTIAINAIKRLYDIIGDKKRAILYYILYIVISLCFAIMAKFLGVFFSIAEIVICLAIGFILLFVKGKLITPKEKDQNGNL
jgi:uncharacterized membrane protein YhaH (DUF805 family)